MLEKTAKVRLRKLVESTRRGEAGLSSYVRMFDHLVLPRQDSTRRTSRGKKIPRERRRLAPEQLRIIRAIAGGETEVDVDVHDEQSVRDRLAEVGLTMDSIIGESEHGTVPDSLIFYDASFSDATSSGSE